MNSLTALISIFLLIQCVCGHVTWRREEVEAEEGTEEPYLAESIYYELPQDSESSNTSAPGAAGGRPGAATNTHSCGQIRAVPAHLRSRSHMWPHGLGSFYQKYTEAYGIPVLGSNRLSDGALRRACYVVRFMFADRADIRQSFYRLFGRVALMATTEVTTNIPEHASLGSWWNSRARGLGATRDRPVSTGGEENALCLANDKYRVEDIILHEYSHGLHLLGSAYVISGFESRLRSLYNAARAAGLWRNTYSMSTDREYWAEGVQSYFNVNAYSNPPNGIHNHVNTRQKLAGYDPNLYSLIKEVFPCGNNYISRCDQDRESELKQYLKMDCDSNGNDGNKGTVTPLPPVTKGPVTCEDQDVKCSSWAADGWCQRCPGFMSTSCRFSCDTCQSSITTTQAPPPTSCRDYSGYCPSWATAGECQRNAAYMLQYCKKSCNSC